MPSLQLISLREVAWELSRRHSAAQLYSLLGQVRLWLTVLLERWEAHVADRPPKFEGCGLAALPIITPADRAELVQQLNARRLRNPASWTSDVAREFAALMRVMNKVVATSTGAKAKHRVNDDVKIDAVDFSQCNALFRQSFKMFYSPDPDEVMRGVEKALVDLKASKSNRPLTVEGNGAVHILHVVQLRGGDELLLQAVRLLAEAALHDSTEEEFFKRGAVEVAMRISQESSNLEIRCHAARLFFNLAYLKRNRPAFIDKGGLHHIFHLARSTFGDARAGNAQKLILFGAKTMFQLSCYDACPRRVFLYAGFEELWLTFARHPSADIRQRAAGVFNKVSEGGARPTFAHKDKLGSSRRVHAQWCRFMVEEVLTGTMSSDKNTNAIQANKKARQLAAAHGWRIGGQPHA